jgi:hypothetical protein
MDCNHLNHFSYMKAFLPNLADDSMCIWKPTTYWSGKFEEAKVTKLLNFLFFK